MLAEVDAEIAKIEAKLANIEVRAKEARANELSVRAGTVARDLTPGFEELQTLKARQAQLRSALDDPLVRQKVADLKQVETAYDAVTRAIRSWLDPAEKARRLDELEIQALQAKTPAQKAAIAEERRRLELAGQAIPVAIAEADITRAGTKARAEATQAHIDQSRVVEVNTRATLGLADAWLKGAAAAQQAEVRRKALTEAVQNGVDVETRARELLREQIAEQAAQSAKSATDLTAEAAAQRKLNDAVAAGTISTEQAQRLMQVEQALRPLIIAQALAEGDAKGTLARVIDALRGAYARLARRAGARGGAADDRGPEEPDRASAEADRIDRPGRVAAGDHHRAAAGRAAATPEGHRSRQRRRPGDPRQRRLHRAAQPGARPLARRDAGAAGHHRYDVQPLRQL